MMATKLLAAIIPNKINNIANPVRMSLRRKKTTPISQMPTRIRVAKTKRSIAMSNTAFAPLGNNNSYDIQGQASYRVGCQPDARGKLSYPVHIYLLCSCEQ